MPNLFTKSGLGALAAIAFVLSACGGDDAPASDAASHPHEQQEQHDEYQQREQGDEHPEQHGTP